MGMAAPTWAESAGSSIGLREKPSANILYEDESQYCYIAVRQLSKNPDRREFVQDKLKHSEIIMGEIRNLQYFYQQIYAVVTHRLSRGKDKLSTLTIGGGGYVFPRYVQDVWPQSRIDVVEIDPGVTEAAIQAFGLERDTQINTITMDARNYIDELLACENAGAEKTRYDFIYGDAINGYSVPYQLVTREFNDKIAGILTDNGVYMINLIDIFDSGLFVGAVVNTLKHIFPNVYVLSANATRGIRNTFVVIAAKQEIDLENLTIQHSSGVDIWYLDDTEINTLMQKSRAIILTDDYVPVENMLAPVVRQDAMGFLSEKYLERAQKLRRRGKLDESITLYKKLVKVNPAMSISACSQIALMSEEQGRLEEAAEAFQQVIEHNEQAKAKINAASIHLKLGFLLKALALKRSDESREHFRKAISGFLRELAENPRSHRTATIGCFVASHLSLALLIMEASDLSEDFGPVPPVHKTHRAPRPKYPQNSLISVSWRLQPQYNPTTNYLPIRKNVRFVTCFVSRDYRRPKICKRFQCPLRNLGQSWNIFQQI